MADFIPLEVNGYDLKEAYNRLKNAEVVESTEMTLTYPKFKDVVDIEIGEDNTKKSILRLKDGGFCVVNKIYKVTK